MSETPDRKRIRDICEDHADWLDHAPDGRRADFSGMSLRWADLAGLDLSRANFSGADLHGANFNLSTLSGADFSKANLDLANLTEAAMPDANLYEVDLLGTIGNGREIKSMQLDYPITYTRDRLQIGEHNHEIKEWWGFNARAVEGAGGHTMLEWWRTWRPIIRHIIKKSPAR